MQGQAIHFTRYATESVPYALKRYKDETKRLYTVLENHLAEGREYLAASQFTIADISTFTWVRVHYWVDVSLDDFPNLKAWLDRIGRRPAVVNALEILPRN